MKRSWPTPVIRVSLSLNQPTNEVRRFHLNTITVWGLRLVSLNNATASAFDSAAVFVASGSISGRTCLHILKERVCRRHKVWTRTAAAATSSWLQPWRHSEHVWKTWNESRNRNGKQFRVVNEGKCISWSNSEFVKRAICRRHYSVKLITWTSRDTESNEPLMATYYT